MRFPFNERKAAQAAAYLLKKHGGRLNYMKLIKLLYLADRASLIARGMPITGDHMVSMPKGPVLSGILDLINWGASSGERSAWLEYISPPEGYEVRLVTADPDLDRLSERECEILDEIDASYGKVDRWSLVELTHQLPEWCDPCGSSKPIDPAEILRASGRSDREIQRVSESAEQALLIQTIANTELHSG
jgi:uncharacterized phage-associated protein